MGCRRLALSVFVLSLFLASGPEPARAHGAAGLAAAFAAPAEMRGTVIQPVLHSKRARSYYCYPHVYWWFYRPYTTGKDGHLRCMPYFHVPGQDQYFKRGAGTGRLK